MCKSEEREKKKFFIFRIKIEFSLENALARLRRSLASFLASDVNDEASKHKPRLNFSSSDQSRARGGGSIVLETAGSTTLLHKPLRRSKVSETVGMACLLN